jgi:hypothetical protein
MTYEEMQQPQNDVEALVRLAGDYVRASDDLRPRFLEAARAARRDRHGRRRILRAATLLILAALALPSFFDGSIPTGGAAQVAAWARDISDSSPASASSGDASWEMVESFTELRRQQARMLRLAL